MYTKQFLILIAFMGIFFINPMDSMTIQVHAAPDTFDCTTVSEIPQVECEALVDIYNSTGGPNWNNNTGWLTTTTPCSWYGLTCRSGFVAKIRLDNNVAGNNLNGPLPASIGDLAELNELILNSNNIGPIPPEIDELRNLVKLALVNTQLSNLPPEIGNLTSLHSLFISTNQLSSIPAEIGNLRNLSSLQIRENQLISVPSEIGNLTNLRELQLQSNQLSSIPPKISNLSNLNSALFDLRYNRITITDTTLQSFLNTKDGDWQQTQTVAPSGLAVTALSDNNVQLTWTPIAYITDGGHYEISYATSEDGPYIVHGTTINKSSNSYTVSGLNAKVPYYIRLRTYTPAHDIHTSATQQNELRSDYSEVVSAIPLAQNGFDCNAVSEIPLIECGALVSLYENIDGPNWDDNTGWLVTTMPCSWYGVTCSNGHIIELDLSGETNSLFGVRGALPSEIGNFNNLTLLYLYNNQLSSIPSDIGNLNKLEVLSLGSNPLTSIPDEIWTLNNLATLALHHNQLSSIPPDIGNLNNLTYLDLNSNELTNIPDELWTLNNLEKLFLHSNQLSSIPPDIGNLNKLEVLFLDENQLSSLPPTIENLNDLKALHLSNNQLSSLPDEIWILDTLTTFELDGNQLSSLPAEIGNFNNLTRLYLHNNQLGTLPPAIGNLTDLEELHLNDNRLTSVPPEISLLDSLTLLDLDSNQLESVPTQIRNLDNLTSFDIAYNRVTTADPSLQSFLNEKDSDWMSTQTVVPADLSVTAILENSIKLTWTPITYTSHGGFYEISYATSPESPYEVYGMTSDKIRDENLVTGLQSGETYYFRVRTYTPERDDQQNELWSDYSEVISATTDGPTPTVTHTPTFAPTATGMPTPTDTVADMPTFTNTPTDTATATPTNTAIDTATATHTLTHTLTSTATSTDTPTATHTPTPTNTLTSTPTPLPTTDTPLPPTFTPTLTATNTVTNTATSIVTDTPIPTNTSTTMATDTPVPTDTLTAAPTDTPLPSATFTATPTPQPTYTLFPTYTNFPTHTPLPTDTPTDIPTRTPTFTRTSTATHTSTTTPTLTLPTATPTDTDTDIGTEVVTATLTYTPTAILTATSTMTSTATSTPTMTDTATTIPTETPSSTPTPMCYQLTLNKEGSGTSPIASPIQSMGCSENYYFPGESIKFTAQPVEGWTVEGWRGTDNDSKKSADNTLSMLAADHEVTVIYSEISSFDSIEPVKANCRDITRPGEDTPTSCVVGIIYISGVPRTGVQVEIISQTGISATDTTQAKVSNPETRPYYHFDLSNDSLQIQAGQLFTVQVSYDGITKTVPFVTQPGRQQVDVIIPSTVADYPIATINHLSKKTLAVDDILTAYGMGQIQHATHEISTTNPITAYRWESDVDGILGESATLKIPVRELSPGTHILRFQVQDNLGAWSPPVIDEIYVSRSSQVDWVMLLYLAGDYIDNDKQWGVFKDVLSALEDIKKPQLRIVAQVDGYDRDAQRWVIDPTRDVSKAVQQEPPLGEVAMDDPQTLIDFLKWGQELYPAKHYHLIIADHGQGARGIAWDTTSDWGDDGKRNDSAYLTVKELGQALNHPEVAPVDVLHLDACSMNLVEVAYEIGSRTQVLIASQYLGWDYFAYDRYIEAIKGDTDPQTLGRSIVEKYGEMAQEEAGRPYTISALDMRYLNGIMETVDKLAAELAPRVRSGEIPSTLLQTIRAGSQSFDSQGDFINDEGDLYIDLAHWVTRLQKEIDIPAIQEQAKMLTMELEDFVLANKFQSGRHDGVDIALDSASGISIFYPRSPYHATHQRYINHDQFEFTRNSRWSSFLNGAIGVLPPDAQVTPEVGPLDRLSEAATSTATATPDPVWTATATWTPVPTWTSTSTPTLPPTATPMDTATPTPTPSPTDTLMPPTATSEPTAIVTATPTATIPAPQDDVRSCDSRIRENGVTCHKLYLPFIMR